MATYIANYVAEIAEAVRIAQKGDIIVVDTDEKREIALIAMKRMNKTSITVEVRS